MQLILSRHGNTFSPQDAVVWVGAKQDLPLVDSGVLQAKCLGLALQKADIQLKAVYCGPLKRAYDYASIVLKASNSPLKPIVDLRLNEIDYGNWSGLSNVQIQEMGEGSELSAWENFSVWPQNSNWQGSAAQIISEVKALAKDLVKQYEPKDDVLLISSNGRLRYFLKLVSKAFEQHVENKALKVLTGNICFFLYENEKWQIKFWNKNPHYLLKST
jgi:probable phosphoglycerate mutase